MDGNALAFSELPRTQWPNRAASLKLMKSAVCPVAKAPGSPTASLGSGIAKSASEVSDTDLRTR